jgi:hypothetical protein
VGKSEHDFLEGMSHSTRRRGPFEQALDKAQMGGAIAISQKPIVTDSDEALGQGVEEKAHVPKGAATNDPLVSEFHPSISALSFPAFQSLRRRDRGAEDREID